MSSSALRTLVTGANRGIGLGLAAAYAERGDDVFAVCRRTSPELADLGVEVIDGVDLTDAAAIAQLPNRIGSGDLDVLICNAGINTDSPGLDDIEVSQLAEMFDVNTLGCVRTVLALLPRMSRGSKIMFVSSMGLIPLGVLGVRTVGNYGYRMSKAALISFGHALAHDVRERGIAVAITSPGRVDTGMLRTVFAEGRASASAVSTAADIYEVGRLLRARMDKLRIEESPAFDRDAEGNAAVPAEVSRLLREANSTQCEQAGEMATPYQ